MGRQNKRSRTDSRARCKGCEMRTTLCLCQDLPRAEAATRVLLLRHKTERRLPTNTARLVELMVPGTRIVEHGQKGQPVDIRRELEAEPSGTRAVLLYPLEPAAVLDAEWRARNPGPVTLVVPDGTWRQAARMIRRAPGLLSLPRVTLPPGPLSNYGLRREPQPGYVCTVEAVARALEALEGEAGPRVRASLERGLRMMVGRVLWSRGLAKAPEVEGGIPDVALTDFYGERALELVRQAMAPPAPAFID